MRDLIVLALLTLVIYLFISGRLQFYYISILALSWLTGVLPIPIPSAESALFFKKDSYGLQQEKLV
jgi:hypothetical protein